MSKRKVSLEEARSTGGALGVEWTEVSQEEFRRGLEAHSSV